ncbi:MAG: alpha/beta hydrolase family protein [Woeseiaceae bacterium]
MTIIHENRILCRSLTHRDIEDARHRTEEVVAMTRYVLGIFALMMAIAAPAQQNRIDIIRHDAPELAYFGDYDIGVRTLELTDPNRPDILNTVEGGETVLYDRRLTVEVWYPAQLADHQQAGGVYTTATRNTIVTATLHGKAVRGASPMRQLGPVPLVIISHGYPGNRYLMSHLAENLASKGYIVVAIDHRDSTYRDQQAAASAMYNSPLDQLFVLDQLASMSRDAADFLRGMVDADRSGIIGYSFGGMALVNNIGGGYSETAVASDVAPVNRLAYRHAAANSKYRENRDRRIKAAVAIAPWGMASGVWEPRDLAGIRVPTLYMAGSEDETSGYEHGVRAIFEHARLSDRYLLTFEHAGHNAIAPIPLPIEIMQTEEQIGASHYTDAVWDSVRSANIMNHFITAFLDLNLKADSSRQSYLDLLPNSRDGLYSMDDGQPTETHTYWKGFPRYSARGLRLERLKPAE